MSLFIQTIDIRKQESKSYIWQIPVIQKFQKLQLTTPVTFFVGENGTGKSTLLEAIAVAFGLNPEGGSRNFQFSSRDSHSGLADAMVLGKSGLKVKDSFFLRAESFYNVASYVDEVMEGNHSEYGGRSLHEQSHGESFLNLALNRFRGNGVYLLDEPEAALSPQRLLSLMIVIHELAQQGSQFIIATHSPILLALPHAAIFEFSDSIREITYEESEVYQLTSLFINHREQVLHQLFQKE